MAKIKKDTIGKLIQEENLLVGPVSIVLATVVGYIFEYTGIPETNIAIVFLLAVVASTIFTQNYVISIFYSIAATLAFNYFFTVPYMAFEIDNISYIITFVIMVAVSLIISMLTQRIKNNTREANRRAEENRALYVFSNQLSAATDLEDIMHISACNINRVVDSDITMIYMGGTAPNTGYKAIKVSAGKAEHSRAVFPAGVNNLQELMDYYKDSNSVSRWHITGSEGLQAVVLLPDIRVAWMDDNQRRVISVMLDSTVMAIDRWHATEKQNHLLQENERERYRSSLLRAISHDLRTPLSGIMGTSEMIMGMTEKSDHRYELAQEIREDADWLHSLMENILNLTRLEDNSHALKKQPEAIEEIIAVTLDRFEKRSRGHELTVNIPDELMLVPMDAKLIVQVLMNLLDNSLKHTTQGQEISLSVEKQGDCACFTVADRGTGILPEDLPYIFQMYYTSSKESADSKKGMGLGLAICSAVVKAHGGKITAENRPGGGAKFTFTLPMEDQL